MKRLVTLAVTLVLLAAMLMPVSVEAIYAGSLYFKDGMTEHGDERWYSKILDQAYEAGLMFGIGDEIFDTGLNVRASEVICVIYRAAKASRI